MGLAGFSVVKMDISGEWSFQLLNGQKSVAVCVPSCRSTISQEELALLADIKKWLSLSEPEVGIGHLRCLPPQKRNRKTFLV